MIRRALIFVPHPDDEINLAGGIYDTLNKNNVYTTVVICTNGDYFPDDTTKRFYEAKRTQSIYKYQELVFLGYGDGYRGKHIYDAGENEQVISHSGHVHTYCGGYGSEYCFAVTGLHHSYNRENLKNDIRSIIIDKKADLLICVDLDSHVDHRCLSLLFDECIGDILKETNYRPYILKGFAYNGVWFGPNDFFDKKIKSTTIDLKQGEDINKKTFPYKWNSRIRIRNSFKTQSLKLWENPTFRALLANKSQCDYYKVGFCALYYFPRIANPDSCYWYRSSKNIALYSDIEVSSGDACYLNDFLLAKPSITIKEDLTIKSMGWTPDVNDREPIICIKLPYIASLRKIVIYQNYDSKINALKIEADNGFKKIYNCLDSSVHELLLPSIQTTGLKIFFLSYCSKLTVNEIELYENEDTFPWNETPFEEYIDAEINRNMIAVKAMEFMFKILVRIILFFSMVKSKANHKYNF